VRGPSGGAARSCAALLTLACASVPSPARALGKIEEGSASAELTGNVRLLGGFLHFDPSLGIPDDALLGAVGRLILKGNFSKDFDYDVHGFIDIDRAAGGSSGGVGGTFSTAGSFLTPYRTRYLSWGFWSSGNNTGTLGIDRLSLHGRVGRVDITAGRFPINDSVAHIIPPNDFFAPFSATAINKAYKPGVDAVRVAVSLGRLSAIELRGVLGSDVNTGAPRWAESALMLRANTVLGGFDFAVVAAKLAERWVAGGTFQGSIGPIDLRGEGHVGIGDKSGDGSGFRTNKPYGRFSTGLTWKSTWRNFAVDAEYAYYSDGAGSAAQYLARRTSLFPDDLPFLGQHYLGLDAGLDIVAILRVNVLGLVNAGDGSGIAVASLNYDISDESAFSAGLMIPWGPSSSPLTLQSEFGLYPITLFAESRFYF
jgi:hypothetical protein